MTTQATFNPQAFIELALSRGVLKFGEFTLKSGRVSPYFLMQVYSMTVKPCHYWRLARIKLTECNNVEVVFWSCVQRDSILLLQQRWLCHKIRACLGVLTVKKPKDHGEGGSWLVHLLKAKVWIIDDV